MCCSLIILHNVIPWSLWGKLGMHKTKSICRKREVRASLPIQQSINHNKMFFSYCKENLWLKPESLVKKFLSVPQSLYVIILKTDHRLKNIMEVSLYRCKLVNLFNEMRTRHPPPRNEEVEQWFIANNWKTYFILLRQVGEKNLRQ